MVNPCKNKVIEKQNFGEYVESYMNTHDFEKAVFGHCPIQQICFYHPPAHFLYKITDCNPLSSRCRGTTLNPNFLYKIEVGGRKEKNKKPKKTTKKNKTKHHFAWA